MAMLRMGALLAAAALTLVLLATGCDTKNVGTGLPTRGPVVTATFWADETWSEGLTATLTVTWVGGTGPFTIGCDMGGGTTDDVPAETPAVSPYTKVFMLIQGTWTYAVTVTDARGRSDTASGTYEVIAGCDYVCIESATYSETTQILTVDVSDPDPGETLTVTVTVPEGLEVDATSKVAAQTTGTAWFLWSAEDVIRGGSGTTDVTVSDGHSAMDITSVFITVPGVVPPDGALIAVPVDTTATTADTVGVVVIAGTFTAGAFNYCDGVGLTVNEGADYVANSFNVGLPGGAPDEVDGIWADMSPAPTGFIMPPDFMIDAQPTGIPGLVRVDFNLTPIGGGDVTNSGALFNFELEFSAAGTYQLGFQLFEDVRRTYYSASDSTTYEWFDITNDHPGIPNSIEVT